MATQPTAVSGLLSTYVFEIKGHSRGATLLGSVLNALDAEEQEEKE